MYIVEALGQGDTPSNPWPKHDGPHQGAGPASQVDDPGACEVIELPEQEI